MYAKMVARFKLIASFSSFEERDIFQIYYKIPFEFSKFISYGKESDEREENQYIAKVGRISLFRK